MKSVLWLAFLLILGVLIHQSEEYHYHASMLASADQSDDCDTNDSDDSSIDSCDTGDSDPD